MKFKQKIISSVLSLSLIASNLFISNAEQQQLEAHFIDVGQGDSIYIELPDGTDILVDGGLASKGSNVVNYLKQQEKDIDIEYLVATHPDADHVGGMQEVFNQLNVKEFYYPVLDTESDSETWKNVLDLAHKEGGKVYNTATNYSLANGEVIVKFVQPSKDYSDNNADSVVILVDYNNTEILLTGDATSQTEKDMISSNLVSDIDILKVGHHGSNTSTTEDFLNTIKPEYSIISVGAENNYGHPTQTILNRLNSIGSKIWRTDENGTIVVKTDGNNIHISDSKGNSFNDETNTSVGEWKQLNGYWYYYLNGVKQTGWVNDAGTWYYLNNNGVMQTGWLNDNGTWYYLEPSGAMAIGWVKVNGVWYYLDKNGAMQTGWLNDNGTWYYLDGSGSMQTGWLNLGGIWYYLDGNGAMQTGWQLINGTWYYMYSSGQMATNTVIDGWNIDGNGVATPISNSNNNNSSSQVQGTVYVTPNGKSYHSTKNCTALKRSTTILSVSLQEAINQGKSDPCNLCH